MKKTFKVLASALACVALVFIAVAADTSGISLSGPQGLDNPIYKSRSYLPTNNWISGPLTNGAQLLLTNVYFNIYTDQGVGFSISTAQQSSGAVLTTNVNTIYIDLSYDGGRTFTTHRPISLSLTAIGSNSLYRPSFFVPYTNFAGAQLGKISSISNTTPAGTLNHQKLWPSNIVVGTRPPPHWGR